jgi:hypothetical protein
MAMFCDITSNILMPVEVENGRKIKYGGRKGKGETEDSGFRYHGLKENLSQCVTHSLHRNQCCFGDGHVKLIELVIVDIVWYRVGPSNSIKVKMFSQCNRSFITLS